MNKSWFLSSRETKNTERRINMQDKTPAERNDQLIIDKVTT